MQFGSASLAGVSMLTHTYGLEPRNCTTLDRTPHANKKGVQAIWAARGIDLISHKSGDNAHVKADARQRVFCGPGRCRDARRDSSARVVEPRRRTQPSWPNRIRH
ncbi:hypothetical protein BDZ89DRAFT_325175 [Hymenopellis radicata]|nr:hypothetical protein BDZ89DRAFT_325175 [Hymenopellis radicata]